MKTTQKHILFVCTGNICRSPMAEALLRKALEQTKEPLRSLKVLSCGTEMLEGWHAALESINAMSAIGIDIRAHRSQGVSADLVKNALAIFALSPEHITRLKNWYESILPEDTFLITKWTETEPQHGIADPYGATQNVYNLCRDEIAETIPAIIAYLEGKLSA